MRRSYHNQITFVEIETQTNAAVGFGLMKPVNDEELKREPENFRI